MPGGSPHCTASMLVFAALVSAIRAPQSLNDSRWSPRHMRCGDHQVNTLTDVCYDEVLVDGPCKYVRGSSCTVTSASLVPGRMYRPFSPRSVCITLVGWHIPKRRFNSELGGVVSETYCQSSQTVVSIQMPRDRSANCPWSGRCTRQLAGSLQSAARIGMNVYGI